MATTVHRGTPASSLNPNPQVSAPVLEFRCMFTHDIFKKSKKWHDGSLRFHTFNKRVMVYDDTKNLVGDLHYRQSEEFGEGLELKLDRPVLVQVEEPLGQTNTDLTQLLGRQRQDGNDHSSLPTQPTRATLSRINAANLQARPKSIRELLGASQGKLGRARLPTQSPFEQRQALSDIQPTAEPPPKRRKIGIGKENEPIAGPVQAASARPIFRATTLTTLKSAQPTGPIVNISSDDELSNIRGSLPRNNALVREKEARSKHAGSPPPPKLVKQKDKNRRSLDNSKKDTISKRQQKATKNAGRHQGAAAPAPNTSRHTTRDGDVEPCPEKPPAKHKEDMLETDCTHQRPEQSAPPSVSVAALRSRSSSAASLQSHRRLTSGPRSSLKFASQAPRPKLMYKGLRTGTPKEASNTSRTSTALTPVANVQSVDAEQPRVRPGRKRSTDLLDTDSLFAASQIAQKIAALQHSLLQDKAQTQEVPAPPDDNHLYRSPRQPLPEDDAFDFCTDEVHVEQASESPLFMPRTASQLSPFPSQSLVFENQDFLEISEDAPCQSPPFSMSTKQRSLHEQTMPGSPQRAETAKHQADVPSSPAFVAAVPMPGKQTSTKESPGPRVTNLTASRKVPLEPSSVSVGAEVSVVSKVKGRLFRRVVSEQVPATITTDEFPEDENTGVALDQPAGPRSKLSLIEVHDKDTSEAPARLQRAASDPVTLESTVTDHHLISSPPSAEKDTDQCHTNAEATSGFPLQPNLASVAQLPPAPPTTTDIGPWTATEAFLLFDWWPPGKHKPDYGQGAQATSRAIGMVEDSASTNMKAVANKKYGTFGSARLVSQR